MRTRPTVTLQSESVCTKSVAPRELERPEQHRGRNRLGVFALALSLRPSSIDARKSRSNQDRAGARQRGRQVCSPKAAIATPPRCPSEIVWRNLSEVMV